MSTSQLERLRTLHEDVELFERAAAEELAARTAMKSVRACPSPTRRLASAHSPPRPARAAPEQPADQIMSDHTTHALISHIAQRSSQLAALYDDEDGLYREELDAMTGDGAIDDFYDRLGRLREMHAAAVASGDESATAPIAADASEQMIAAILDAEPPVVFSGEEGDGRFLDLHELHDSFVNLPHIKPAAASAAPRGPAKAAWAVDYYTFLTKHALEPAQVPMRVSRTHKYHRCAHDQTARLRRCAPLRQRTA
jgi:splicing factor 3A subunit 3